MTNQMLLATGALFILTLLILLFYQTSTEQASVSIENEAMLTGSGIAQSLISEILKRSFITQFDDIDDFDSYSIIDSSTRLSKYNLWVNVGYISDMNPNNTVDIRTYKKKVVVSLLSMYLPATLKLYHVIGY